MKFNHKAIAADRRKMERYICRRIPDDGMRIFLTADTADAPPIFADLTPLRGGAEDELVIESNEPEAVDLKSIYQHFRWQEMTVEEKWRELTFIDPRRLYRQKVAALSETERRLLNAASENDCLSGEALAAKIRHKYDGHVKGCLSILVKLGLLTKSSRAGYLRVRKPTGVYEVD